MAEPGDPVTHGEFDALLEAHLKPLADKVGAVLDRINPLADPDPDPEPDPGVEVTFTLRQMEEYAKAEVQKATKILAAKKPKVEPKVDPEPKVDDPLDGQTAEDLNKLKPEPTPIKDPAKKSMAERMWG